MPRERKRKICSCCESPAPKMTSLQPDVKKRRHEQKQNKVQSNPQPVLDNVKEPVKRSVVTSQDPVNLSKSVTMSKVLACEMEEMNEDIVLESAGHSTRRIKRRERCTVRGLGASHIFIKEVTYTFASTKVGYVGQELLPFRVRPDWFNLSLSAQEKPSISDADYKPTNSDSQSDAFSIPSDFSESKCDDSLNKAFFRSEGNDSCASDGELESDPDIRNTLDGVSGGVSDKDIWSRDGQRDFRDSSGRDTRNDNNLGGLASDLSDSDFNDDANGCDPENGKGCEKHNTWQWCSCRWSPCSSERRPIPETCPREMKELVEAFLSGSRDKQEYEIMKEVKYDDSGCSPCIYLYNNEQITQCNRQLRNLRLDRTFNLGVCYVTAFVFRNSNLIFNNSIENMYGPLMTGPVMLHFDEAFDTYVRFFQTVREKAGIVTKPMSDREVDNMRYVPKKTF